MQCNAHICPVIQVLGDEKNTATGANSRIPLTLLRESDQWWRCSRGDPQFETNLVVEHLENKNAYVRSVFIDFSSAFNTLKPDIVINKLRTLNVSPILCKFILGRLLWARCHTPSRCYCVEI